MKQPPSAKGFAVEGFLRGTNRTIGTLANLIFHWEDDRRCRFRIRDGFSPVEQTTELGLPFVCPAVCGWADVGILAEVAFGKFGQPTICMGPKVTRCSLARAAGLSPNGQRLAVSVEVPTLLGWNLHQA